MFIPGRRDPSEFIQYLNIVDVDFEFHIYTQTPQFVKGINSDLMKIFIHDPVPRKELMNILSSMDF